MLTREEWLTDAVAECARLFKREVPAVRVSVGWPGGRGPKSKTIGQCWAPTTAADGVAQIFISPVLDDARTVLATLVHELCHAVDRCEHKHGAPFRALMREVDLAGKPTATEAGPELAARLNAMVGVMPAYPHAKLSTAMRAGEPKQTTRLFKVQCPECEYSVRVTRKWLDESGGPLCPVHQEPMAPTV